MSDKEIESAMKLALDVGTLRGRLEASLALANALQHKQADLREQLAQMRDRAVTAETERDALHHALGQIEDLKL